MLPPSLRNLVLLVLLLPTAALQLRAISKPLQTAGQHLSSSGISLVELTRKLDLYGSNLSQAGADMRNAGDSISQAGVSALNKFASESIYGDFIFTSESLRSAASRLEQEAKRDQGGKEEALRIPSAAVVALRASSDAFEGVGRLVVESLQAKTTPPLLAVRFDEAGGAMGEVGEALAGIEVAAAAAAEWGTVAQGFSLSGGKLKDAADILSGKEPAPKSGSWLK